MTFAILLTILLLSATYFFVRTKQLERRFSRRVRMTVNYMFQERPGQYSGDRNTRSGVFVFKAQRYDDQLKNIVIRRVKPLHSALDVNLEQILVIPFAHADTRHADVSVRFKVIKRGAKVDDLKGKRVNISGVLNFEQGRPEPFVASLPITDVYQSTTV